MSGLIENPQPNQEVELKMNSLSSQDIEDNGTVIFVLDPLDNEDLSTLEKSLKEKGSGADPVQVVATKLNYANKEN